MQKLYVSCRNCFEPLTTTTADENEFSKFVQLKEYKDGSLIHPSKDTFLFFLAMEMCFRTNEENLFLQNTGHKQLLLDIMNETPEIVHFTYPMCHNIKLKIQKRFVTFRLKIYGMKRKKIIQKENKPGTKALP